MAHLVITSGQLEGRRIEVTEELVVGRENVDVEIEDVELSRRHFAIRPVAGGLEVEDLGSRNGTRVDGTRIDAPTRVAHGAVVTVGMTTFVVELPEAAPAGGGAAETRAHASQGTVPGDRPAAGAVVTSQPFGRYQASSSQRRRKAASRLWLPQALTYVAVAGTAAGLIVYFA